MVPAHRGDSSPGGTDSFDCCLSLFIFFSHLSSDPGEIFFSFRPPASCVRPMHRDLSWRIFGDFFCPQEFSITLGSGSCCGTHGFRWRNAISIQGKHQCAAVCNRIGCRLCGSLLFVCCHCFQRVIRILLKIKIKKFYRERINLKGSRIFFINSLFVLENAW